MCYLARGTRVGREERYQVEAWLGFSESRAGWELFAARDLATGDAVLVKAFPAGEDLGDVEDEASRANDLSHPSIAPVLEVGVVSSPWGGELEYAIEGCAPGRSLERVLAARPAASEVASLLKTLADGVAYLRQRDRLVDIPAPEVFVQDGAQARWGIVGQPALDPSGIPSALAIVSTMYPELGPTHAARGSV